MNESAKELVKMFSKYENDPVKIAEFTNLLMCCLLEFGNTVKEEVVKLLEEEYMSDGEEKLYS